MRLSRICFFLLLSDKHSKHYPHDLTGTLITDLTVALNSQLSMYLHNLTDDKLLRQQKLLCH